MKKLTLCSLTLISLSASSAQATELYCSENADRRWIFIQNAVTEEVVGRPIRVRNAALRSDALQACNEAVAPFACERSEASYMHTGERVARAETSAEYQLVIYGLQGDRNGSGTTEDRMSTEAECLATIREAGVSAIRDSLRAREDSATARTIQPEQSPYNQTQTHQRIGNSSELRDR